MASLRNRYVGGPVALMVALVVTAVAALAWGGPATSAPASSRTATAAAGTVAQNNLGELSSTIRGTTANGRSVTGEFVPLKFSKRNGKVFVRGLVQGVVHNADESTRTFGVVRTVRVRSINGTPIRTGAAARALQAPPACDVLNLRLGPLDLDLLGLQVNLNRIVLDIVAQSGAGNLLGNLLCAVAGLLDGGLNGLLGRITNLLNQILGRLGLGL
ncbi:ABC transporter substrate-binding protein [Nocardioides euryhalodurans]|uniref:ABC transporter substrate-binding protein n=1 Tax=Nocardioides euryhalodurans TaxID=2518370 RepID=A0A4P7GP28_9ACTN|nr:ABC transporter substrate-binding protein [Nocardioides euryhalodurans]QBR93986.1 ABC transporter substrate-binding protein [Nocardioides euryhalodurans]